MCVKNHVEQMAEIYILCITHLASAVLGRQEIISGLNIFFHRCTLYKRSRELAAYRFSAYVSSHSF
jgi:hypothetical protein